MSDWDFGGAYANTAGALQQQDQARQAFPLQQAHQLSVNRLNNANAGLAEEHLRAERAMTEMMQGMTLDPKASTSSSIMQMAGVAMKAGDGATARDLLLRASQIRTQEAREAQSVAQQQKYKAEYEMKLADRYVGLLSGVKSQEDLDRANFIFQAEFGEQPPQIRYDPRMIGILKESTVKMRDKVYAEHTKALEALQARRLNDTREYRSELLKLRKGEQDRKVAADEAKTKNAGKDVGAPSKMEIESARDLLTRENKTAGLDAPSQRTAAFDLASRARSLRRQNPGLDAGEAMTRALMEQVQQGYYTTKKATSMFGKDKTVYGRPGRSPDTPLPVPQDRSTLKPQSYYSTPKGTLLYLGGGKWQVPEAAMAGGGDDSEDEED